MHVAIIQRELLTGSIHNAHSDLINGLTPIECFIKVHLESRDT